MTPRESRLPRRPQVVPCNRCHVGTDSLPHVRSKTPGKQICRATRDALYVRGTKAGRRLSGARDPFKRFQVTRNLRGFGEDWVAGATGEDEKQ